MKIEVACTKSSLIRLELKTYQRVKQLWIKWAKFKRYVKVWKEEGVFFFFLLFSLVFRACFLFLQITKKNEKQKQKKLFPHNGVRSWLAYPEILRFQVFSLFLIFRDHTRCTAKNIHSREDKKKNFPLLFLIRCDHARCMEKTIHSQGKQHSKTKT